MSTYRVVVNELETLYEGNNLVQALDTYGYYRQHLRKPDEHVVIVELGRNEDHDKIIAEFIGGRQLA